MSEVCEATQNEIIYKFLSNLEVTQKRAMEELFDNAFISDNSMKGCLDWSSTHKSRTASIFSENFFVSGFFFLMVPLFSYIITLVLFFKISFYKSCSWSLTYTCSNTTTAIILPRSRLQVQYWLSIGQNWPLDWGKNSQIGCSYYKFVANLHNHITKHTRKWYNSNQIPASYPNDQTETKPTPLHHLWSILLEVTTFYHSKQHPLLLPWFVQSIYPKPTIRSNYWLLRFWAKECLNRKRLTVRFTPIPPLLPLYIWYMFVSDDKSSDLILLPIL
jgi:hypothetical protein